MASKEKQKYIDSIEIGLGDVFGDLDRLSISSLRALAKGIEKLANPVAAQPPTEKIEMEPEPEADAPASSQDDGNTYITEATSE